MPEYTIPPQPTPNTNKTFTINTKYLGQQILNPRDFPITANAQNVVAARNYQIDPNLVLSQVAAESKYIAQSRGLQALKTIISSKIINSQDAANAENLRKQQQEGTGVLGLPIYDLIQFGGDNTDNVLRYDTQIWDSDKKQFVTKNITVNQTKLTTALLTIEQTKNIITTNIQGRNGPVYEYIGLGAYHINIKGVLVSPYRDVYPTDAVSNLVDILEAPVSLKVTSNILNSVFNILKIVVTDYSFDTDKGMRNVVHFEINCMDENPFEIKNQLV